MVIEITNALYENTHLKSLPMSEREIERQIERQADNAYNLLAL